MKEKILQKSIELFINLGFKSVTMDDIASEMGISKKTIYSHFNNKTELVKAASFRTFESVSDGINCICALHKNPIEELYEIKKYVMVYLKNEKASPQYQLCKYYPEINSSLKKKQFELMQGCVITNFERGLELGLYRTNLTAEYVSRIYFLGITGIKDEELFPFELFTKKSLMDSFLEYHLRGICTPNGIEILTTNINKNKS